MKETLRHIFSLLIALQVVVASTGATFYRHYCNTEGELMSVSAYEPESSCCTAHSHEDHHHNHESEDCQNDACCNLSYEFRKTETAPVAEGLKLSLPLLALVLPERFFGIPLPVSAIIEAADLQDFNPHYSPPLFWAGKSLLSVIQQFRL